MITTSQQLEEAIHNARLKQRYGDNPIPEAELIKPDERKWIKPVDALTEGDIIRFAEPAGAIEANIWQIGTATDETVLFQLLILTSTNQIKAPLQTFVMREAQPIIDNPLLERLYWSPDMENKRADFINTRVRPPAPPAN